MTDALGGYTTLEYDQAGNRTAIEAYDDADALVAKTVQHFDQVNRLWKVVRHRFGSGLTTTYPETVITRDRGHLVTRSRTPRRGSATGRTTPPGAWSGSRTRSATRSSTRSTRTGT